jgi:predicted MFS family arabinose efflux permease
VNLNLPFRLTNYFLPVISRGLGVSLQAAGLLVSVRALMGVTAPLFGVWSDTVGARKVMSLGLALMVVGAALTAGLPWYGAALCSFAIMGISKRRARAMGLVELSWSFALLAMPLCGWLIDRGNWRTPFILTALVGVVALQLTRRKLPPGPRVTGPGTVEPSGGHRENLARYLGGLRGVWNDRNARLAILITGLLIFAHDGTMIVYGAWMEDHFGLSVTALGLVTLVVGAAELVAELGVIQLSDRLGKRRAVVVSLILTGCGYLLLPRATGSLTQALAATAFLKLSFEFCIVGFMPIVSGLNASARGTVMSFNVVATAVGRMVAAPISILMYTRGDLALNGLISALLCLAVLLLLSRLQEHGF